jgi:hypothetical protein
MTVSVLQIVQNGGATSAASISASITPSAGSYLDVYVAMSAETITCSSVTDGTNTYTAKDNIPDSGFNWRLQHFITASPVANTAYTVQANFSGTASTCMLGIVEIGGSSGFLTSTGQLQTAPGTGADQVTSGLLGTLAGVPALVFGFCFQSAGTNVLSTGTGFTTQGNLWGAQHAQCVLMESLRVTANTSIAATFAVATSNHLITTASAWQETAAGGRAPGMMLFGMGG